MHGLWKVLLIAVLAVAMAGVIASFHVPTTTDPRPYNFGVGVPEGSDGITILISPPSERPWELHFAEYKLDERLLRVRLYGTLVIGGGPPHITVATVPLLPSEVDAVIIEDSAMRQSDLYRVVKKPVPMDLGKALEVREAKHW